MKYDVEGFEEIVPVRFTVEQVKQLKRVVRKDTETYDSLSHFIRAAALKRFREERARLKI